VITVPRRPWHFSDDEDAEPERWPARRGEHNEEVLAELGYDAAEIDALRRRGVLVCDQGKPVQGPVEVERLVERP
jgi:crotonobetainyl-CoA:carnitine CoA-transferase CaiB-like acyl-CoA transferase